MRLFYDDYASYRRAEIQLLAGDAAGTAAAVLFASGASERGVLDAILLGLWAAAPRCLARFLAWFEQPSDPVLAVLTWLVLVAGVGGLAAAGWQLLDASGPAGGVPGGVLILTICVWAADLFLFQPRCYRLHDFIVGSLVLVGLIERQPWPQAWVPVVVVSLIHSALVRHLVYDVFASTRRRVVNLQNARALTLVAGLPAAALFIALAALSAGTTAGRSGEARAGGRASVAERGRTSVVLETAGGGSRGTGAQAPSHGDGARLPTSARRVGLTHRVRLEDLSAQRSDTGNALVVRFAGDPNTPGSWHPGPRTLWKAVALSRFDIAAHEWVADHDLREVSWGPRVRYIPRGTPGGPRVELEIEVALPGIDTLAAPYHAVQLGPVASAGPFATLFINESGDLFVRPPLEKGSRYFVRAAPLVQAIDLEPGARLAPDDDPRHLEVPDAAAVGIDLRAIATTKLLGPGGLEARIERLRRYFATELRASGSAEWRSHGAPLRTFLATERVGNCTHFATAAALLLRAAGVSARVVVGFAGGRWETDPDEGGDRYVIPNARAHAWIEVHLANQSWHPLDATAWARDADPGPAGEFAGDLRTGERPSASSGAPRPEDELPNQTGDPLRDDDTSRSLWRDDGTPQLATRPGEGPGGGPFAAAQRSQGWIRAEERALAPRADEAPGSGEEDASTAVLDDADAWQPVTGDATALNPYQALARLALAIGCGMVILVVLVTFLRPGREEHESDPQDRSASGDAGELEVEDLGLSRLDPRDPGHALLLEYHSLQAELRRTRCHRLPHETPFEHGLRLGGRSRTLAAALSALHRLVYLVLYGGQTMLPRDADAARESSRRIRREIG